jgi:hypothetical protein
MNKKIEIDMNALIFRVYNKIALWNNQDVNNEEKTIMLKVLSHEIISDIIATAFSQLEGTKFKETILPATPKKKFWNFFKK